jgi:hypothetical protein
VETGVTGASVERRRHARRGRSQQHGIARARVRPGHAVTVIDISGSGALVETSHRLMPNANVEVHLERDGATTLTARARILRCSVFRLHATVVHYRCAMAFEAVLPLFADDDSHGYLVPMGESPDFKGARVATTHRHD